MRPPLTGQIRLINVASAHKTPTLFTIRRFLGSGGNCLAYYATQINEMGMEFSGLLKEVFPVHLASDRQEDGTLIVPVSQKDAFDARRHMIVTQHKRLNAFVSSHEQVANILTQTYGIFEGNGTSYIFSDSRIGETSYDAIQETSLASLCRHMLELSSRIQKLHSAKLLHLDVKPQNAFLDEVGALHLLDFDSLHPFPLTLECLTTLTCSQDYSPIEQINAEIERIGFPSDIYALAALMYDKIYGYPPYAINPIRPNCAYEHTSPLFHRMRADTYTHLRSLICHALAVSPERRCQTLDEFVIALRHLLKLAERDQQHGMPLFDHCMAAFDLRSTAGIAAADTYLKSIFSEEALQIENYTACVKSMDTQLVHKGQWNKLLFCCTALNRFPLSSGELDYSDRAQQTELEAKIRTFLISAHSCIGQSEEAHALFAEYYQSMPALFASEVEKDSFRFDSALNLINSEIAKCSPHGDEFPTECNQRLHLVKIYGKRAQILCHMNRYDEAFPVFRHCIALTKGLPAEPVHQMTSSTYWLNAACAMDTRCPEIERSAIDQEIGDAFDCWLSCLFLLCGKDPFPVCTPEDHVRLLHVLLSLRDDTADYQKRHLIHSLLTIIRRRAYDASGNMHWNSALREICVSLNKWITHTSPQMQYHPWELIFKLAAQLCAVCGERELCDAYLGRLRTFPAYGREFLETLICLSGELDIACALGKDPAPLCTRLQETVLQELARHADDKARIQPLQKWLAPILSAAPPEDMLRCMTYIYR